MIRNSVPACGSPTIKEEMQVAGKELNKKYLHCLLNAGVQHNRKEANCLNRTKVYPWH